MREALVSRRIRRYYWARSAPPPYKDGALLAHRRARHSLGFAPPPYDGFALLAARTDAPTLADRHQVAT
jgi:hypothetical protein